MQATKDLHKGKEIAGILPAVFVGNGQFLAAVAATGGEHAAAIGAGHSLTEAVLVYATAIVGLKCSFHCYISIFILNSDCKSTYNFLIHKDFATFSPKIYENLLKI